MGRFSHLATQPERGPADMIKWKLGGRRDDPPAPPAAPPPPPDFQVGRRDYDRALVESGRASDTGLCGLPLRERRAHSRLRTVGRDHVCPACLRAYEEISRKDEG